MHCAGAHRFHHPTSALAFGKARKAFEASRAGNPIRNGRSDVNDTSSLQKTWLKPDKLQRKGSPILYSVWPVNLSP